MAVRETRAAAAVIFVCVPNLHIASVGYGLALPGMIFLCCLSISIRSAVASECCMSDVQGKLLSE